MLRGTSRTEAQYEDGMTDVLEDWYNKDTFPTIAESEGVKWRLKKLLGLDRRSFPSLVRRPHHLDPAMLAPKDGILG